MTPALFLLDLVALVGGTVHTMEPEAEPAAATVLIRDGAVEAVLAPDVPVPETARRVDVAGMHVVPGLIDGMVFFDPDHDALYTAQGITTIRDLGGDPVRALLARAPEVRDRIPGPFLLTPGAVVDGDPPSSSEAVILRTPAMADDLLPILFNEEIDFLSTQVGIEPDPFRRAVELAHAQGLEVWGPVPNAMDLTSALEAGLDGVLFLDRLCPESVGWEKILPGGLKKGVASVAEAGAGLVPVLLANAVRIIDQEPENEPAAALELLHPIYAAQWRGELQMRRNVLDEGFTKRGERVLGKQLQLLTMLVESGVAVVPGSASPQPWLVPGEAFHEELALWERAGLAPYDVLARATRLSAEALGLSEERGTIATGKVADLVVVSEDPREGVAALRDPSVVVVRGHVLEREALDDLLATVRTVNAAHRADLARPIEVDPPEVPEGVVVLQGKVDVETIGQRIRAERYAIVREPDGATCYVGRTAYRGVDGQPTRVMNVLQRTRNGKLDEWIVELTDGENSMVSHGLWTAESMRIERRANNALMDTKRVRDRVVCVDVGSITTPLLLTQVVDEEPFQIVTLHELLEPELALWAMGFGGEDALIHVVRTHKGMFKFESTDLGSIGRMESAVGGGVLVTQLHEEDGLGGPGVPPPAEKLALLTAVTAEASAPAEGAPEDAGGDGGQDEADDTAGEKRVK